MIRIKRKYAIFEICSKFCFHINDFYLIYKCKLILLEIESLLKEQLRSRLECQGINVDQVNLFEDLNNLNVNLDDDEQESSDDPGSDSSADDGLPLHLERFAKVSLILTKCKGPTLNDIIFSKKLRQRKKHKAKVKKPTNTPNVQKSPIKEAVNDKIYGILIDNFSL